MRVALVTHYLFLLLILSGCTTNSIVGDRTVEQTWLPAKNGASKLISAGISYQGELNHDATVNRFLGIPFAQPPIGDNRWAPPRELNSHTSTSLSGNSPETRLADTFAPACMQGPHLTNWYRDVIDSFGGQPELFEQPEVSEDCLYLNIWQPIGVQAQDMDSKTPVFVFIHGGSNKGGWSYEPNYMGEQLAKRGVIVITVAYRLGPFGFFSHPDLQHANFGLLDQIAALTWVKSNVDKLGGDPNNITVAGESAGANNIEYLMASPMAQGLFQRVVHQSGGSPMHDNTTKQVNDYLGQNLAEAVGVPSKGVGELRSVTAEKILLGSKDVYGDHYFDPVIDGLSVVEPLSQSLRRGGIAKIDLLIGANADEWTVYLEEDQTVESWLAETLPSQDVTAINKALDNGESRTKQLDRLITAYHFVCPSLRLASEVSEIGGRSWFYNFSRVRPGKLAKTLGAYHGAELPYVFGTHDDWLPTNNEDIKLGGLMMDYWVNFIKSGNPNTALDRTDSTTKLAAWPAYEKAGDLVQDLNVQISSRTHLSEKLCQFVMKSDVEAGG